jgi:hypothetical protein
MPISAIKLFAEPHPVHPRDLVRGDLDLCQRPNIRKRRGDP